MRNASDAPRDPYLLGSLRKGLEVLDCFARAESWTLTELCAELGQSKPTVFRILHTLEEFGYLVKDAATARYSRGLRLYGLGGATVGQDQLCWQSLVPLQDLARQTGETVHVGLLHEAEAICVQAVDGTRLVRMHAIVGKRTPAHASALGKMLLAHRSEAELCRLFAERELTRFTPNSITSLPDLLVALQCIREQGYALDEEEMEVGLRCLGAAILDHAGRACACLAISAPAARMEPSRLAELIPLVRATADRISRMLGAPAVRAA
jgi:DNA-binding IclR family transcriptional regulator